MTRTERNAEKKFYKRLNEITSELMMGILTTEEAQYETAKAEAAYTSKTGLPSPIR